MPILILSYTLRLSLINYIFLSYITVSLCIYYGIIEANKLHYFSTLFWYTTLNVRTELLSIIKSLHTEFTASEDEMELNLPSRQSA